MDRQLFLVCLIFAACLGAGRASYAQAEPSAGMLRYPDISAEKIVFCYAGDLWIVSKEGGMASPLASPPGHEQSPKFSADGEKIAFVGNYDGDDDIYEINTSGGPAQRVTYHPDAEMLSDFTAEGTLIYSTSGFAKLSRMAQVFSISLDHPFPVQMPVPYGTNATLSQDGKWLAYTPYSRDTRTWKRYRGGMASDIWLFHLENHTSKQVTDWEGTDSFPMWHDATLYYLSDAGENHRLNIWKYDLDSGEHEQVTEFKNYDVKTPSIGPGSDGEGEIVFQVGAALRVLNLKTSKSKAIKVTIPGDRPALRPHLVDASEFVESASVSPNAKRVALEARGDIWTAPLENGSPRNLTRSSGVAERFPAWSPNGQWIAYFSDANGEYELLVQPSDGDGKAKQLTHGGDAFRFQPLWSPDSKKLFFYDKSGAMFIHDIENEETTEFDQDPYADPPNVAWSHDSAWLAYTRHLENVPRTQVRVLDVGSGESHTVSSGYFNDSYPAFDRKGDFLYFVSGRDFSQPKYEDVGTTFIYDNTQVLVAVPLRPDVVNPLLPSSDEETWEEPADDEAQPKAEESKKKKGKATKKKRERKRKNASDAGESKMEGANEDEGEEADSAVNIDFEDIESRSFLIPITSGSLSGLAVTADGGIVFARASSKGEEAKPAIKIVTIDDGEAKEEVVVENARGFELTPDGKQLLVSSRGDFYIVKAAAAQKLDKKISTDGMHVAIDRRAEWKQVFHDAWRMERDFFYDPTMHGVDWNAVRRRYEKLSDDCTSRYDLSFVIREMISEINVGHAYYREGDVERGESTPVGLLGCRFEASGDAVKITHLWQGGPWDTDARNPLLAIGVKEGDRLLSVEGQAVSSERNPYSYFVGRTGRSLRMRVQTGEEEPRDVVVEPSSSDASLRFWAGIEAARKYVEEKSGGKVGYIYVTNTGINGQDDLFRQFYAQQEKAALIIDDRWNGGGQIPTRFIELLNRPVTNYWARRDGKDWVWPPDSHQGPKCMLINGLAGSGGDMFPALFKQTGLGKLIGRRTWGGLVGITGYPTLIDGSSVTAPSFAYYETDGTWGIEGHGVDPDIEVIDDPAKMLDGGDPQLDAAIEQMMEEIKEYPKQPPRPAYPDRSKMGLPKADQ